MNSNDLTPSGPFNSHLRMSSVEIASLMDKNHKDVMRDIRELIDQEAIDRRRSAPISYLDSMNREQPMYELDFESSMVLVTGYDANRRALVIKRWMQLERGEALPVVARPTVSMDEHLAVLKENNELLRQMMASLRVQANQRKNFTPDEDAQVLHLHGLGHTPRQIGNVIGRKPDSVRSCLYRLRKSGILDEKQTGPQMQLFPAGVLSGGAA